MLSSSWNLSMEILDHLRHGCQRQPLNAFQKASGLGFFALKMFCKKEKKIKKVQETMGQVEIGGGTDTTGQWCQQQYRWDLIISNQKKIFPEFVLISWLASKPKPGTVHTEHSFSDHLKLWQHWKQWLATGPHARDHCSISTVTDVWQLACICDDLNHPTVTSPHLGSSQLASNKRSQWENDGGKNGCKIGCESL